MLGWLDRQAYSAVFINVYTTTIPEAVVPKFEGSHELRRFLMTRRPKWQHTLQVEDDDVPTAVRNEAR